MEKGDASGKEMNAENGEKRRARSQPKSSGPPPPKTLARPPMALACAKRPGVRPALWRFPHGDNYASRGQRRFLSYHFGSQLLMFHASKTPTLQA